jgi:ribosomal protein L37E
MSKDEVKFITCPECGSEQPDMGKNMRCEECGYGPMPYHDEEDELHE